MRPEKLIRNQIERALGHRSEILLWSNPSGLAEFVRTKDLGPAIQGIPDLSAMAAPVLYGLGGKGGPDLIGILHCQCGSVRFAVGFGVEVKSQTGKRNPDQIAWHKRARSRGMWILEEARSADQVTAWIDERIAGLKAAGVQVLPIDLTALR